MLQNKGLREEQRRGREWKKKKRREKFKWRCRHRKSSPVAGPLPNISPAEAHGGQASPARKEKGFGV